MRARVEYADDRCRVHPIVGTLALPISIGSDSMAAAKKGLYANIHAKQERIAHGSGEKMRKPGSEGAPSREAFAQSAKSEKTPAKKAAAKKASAKKTAAKKAPAKKATAKKATAKKAAAKKAPSKKTASKKK